MLAHGCAGDTQAGVKGADRMSATGTPNPPWGTKKAPRLRGVDEKFQTFRRRIILPQQKMRRALARRPRRGHTEVFIIFY